MRIVGQWVSDQRLKFLTCKERFFFLMEVYEAPLTWFDDRNEKPPCLLSLPSKVRPTSFNYKTVGAIVSSAVTTVTVVVTTASGNQPLPLWAGNNVVAWRAVVVINLVEVAEFSVAATVLVAAVILVRTKSVRIKEKKACLSDQISSQLVL